ncbi:MAG TPA: undecaprenyl-diphosphate phosphatase [Bacteroidetes bacterium]|nr:undecaprenyl-diphosphate phosphatase [Bacteroidota bacterium]
MGVWQSFWLGVLQGVTEFLPISSSGHLVLGKALLGVHTQGVAFEVFVHFGTFLAVVTVFWSDVYQMLLAAGRALVRPLPGHWSKLYKQDRFFRLLVLILVGSIPAGVVGILFEDSIENAFSSPLFVSFMLIVTGVILLGTRWVHGQDREFGAVRGFLIGVAQSLAILPGISRSGSTIATGMYLNVERSEAARFSFLLALPAIFGAAVLKSVELARTGISHHEELVLAVGAVTAYVAGVVALKWLLGVIRRGRLDRFAYYCFAVGVLGILFFGFHVL